MALRFEALPVVGLDVARALKRLVEPGGEKAQLVERGRRDLAHALADLRDRIDRDGKDDAGDQRELPVLFEHDADQKQQGQRILDHAGERVRDGVAHHVDVVGEPRDEPAGRRVLEEREVEAKDVGEDPALQIGDDALANEGHQHRLPVGGGAPDQRYPDDRDRDHDEQRAVLLQEDLVQHRLHEIGERCDGAGGKDHAEPGEQQPAQVGAHVLADEANQEVPRRAWWLGWVRSFHGFRPIQASTPKRLNLVQ